MEDLASYANAGRDIEQALIALKKGSRLLKYGRKGKPKFYRFRLSNDEASITWITSNGERSLKLASVSRIVPGQRTAIFRQYQHPEKEYLSFSLVYNGKRSLDLICNDKVEAEIWIAGLKALTSSGRSKIDGGSDGSFDFDGNSNLTSSSPSTTSASPAAQGLTSANLSTHLESSHVALSPTSMLAKSSNNTDTLVRVSVSSAPSTSSHGSTPDDCDALGDVYVWGEVVKAGPDGASTRSDVLTPRPLESNTPLDVHSVACGARHAALVTRYGEVFTWGEESGGRLGQGAVARDAARPRPVDLLPGAVDVVACGEFHTCAVTTAGDLYAWGLLGHGDSAASHWIPHLVAGPLDGLRVASVACGIWHTALATSAGRVFTFGDGTFGALGHGDRASTASPREVESLSGLRTVTVACGVWHTAAVVEVIASLTTTQPTAGKLFTWGDGDKNRLGHGDKEPRFEPTCVHALIDHNFYNVACGHTLTVGLTTSGRVFTMGSTVYGQLGNPRSDGKLPCLVGDRLEAECVEEISCGAYHVSARTSKNEVYTWGKGANGRLGHGDVEDRKSPVLVEGLKDRHVKSVACGSNSTSAICFHKWVSGGDQPQCMACRQTFGFTRKRHNCYNCGLVHCHSCSSHKVLRAALAPDPGKPHRVCDLCYAKLGNGAEGGAHSRRNSSGSRLSGENKDRLDKAELRLAQKSANFEMMKLLDAKAGRLGKKGDTNTISSGSLTAVRNVPKPVAATSRPASPFSRKPSPPRSATPVPTALGLSFAKSISDCLSKTNMLLTQEVHKLRVQIESLTSRCELQELELQQSVKEAQEAMALAAEESAKCNAAKEVIKSLTTQLKDMAGKLPPGACEPDDVLKRIYLQNGVEPEPEPNGMDLTGPNGEPNSQPAGTRVPLEVPGVDSGVRDDRLDSGSRSRNTVVASNSGEILAEWIEQYEAGVYITLVALRDGTRDLKRVRFSRRRFGEHEAATWWSENRERVNEKYNVCGSDKSSVSGQAARRPEGAFSPSSSQI